MAGDACRDGYHECMVTSCEVCEEIMIWVDCPTGGWWKHLDHPQDDHDGEAPLPVHLEEEPTSRPRP